MQTNCFSLNKDVYIVDGRCMSAIYDFNQGNLYSINKRTRDLIHRLIINSVSLETLSYEEQSLINIFIQEGLLVPSFQSATIHSILDLKKNYPIEFAWLEVTRQCNMACPFCYANSSPHCYERMSFNDFKLVIKNLIEIEVKRIQFIGGEPTILQDELKMMIEYCRSDFDFIEVFTNGMLIDKTWCEFFKKNKIHIALSIHSYLPEEHDKHVNYVGAHNAVTHTVHLFKEFGIPFRIGTVKSKSCHIGEPDETTEYRIRRPDNLRMTEKINIDQYDFEMFQLKAITKQSKRFPLDKKMVSRYVSGHQCFLKDLYIGADLTVFPCAMERRMNYGNLKEKPLTDVLDHPLRFLSKDHIEDCKDCEYRYHCFDCRPDSHGKGVYQKPWYCSYDPKAGEWLNLENMFAELQKQHNLLT